MTDNRSAEEVDNGAEFDSDFEAWFMTRGVYAGYSFAAKRWMMMQAVNERSAFDAGLAVGAASRQGEVDALREALSASAAMGCEDPEFVAAEPEYADAYYKNCGHCVSCQARIALGIDRE